MMRRRKTPHLFAKVIIWYCVVFSTICSICALWIMFYNGSDASGILGVILAFFGGELLLLALKTIFKDRNGGNNDV